MGHLRERGCRKRLASPSVPTREIVQHDLEHCGHASLTVHDDFHDPHVDHGRRVGDLATDAAAWVPMPPPQRQHGIQTLLAPKAVTELLAIYSGRYSYAQTQARCRAASPCPCRDPNYICNGTIGIVEYENLTGSQKRRSAGILTGNSAGVISRFKRMQPDHRRIYDAINDQSIVR